MENKKTSHTPGPWKVLNDGELYVKDAECETLICKILLKHKDVMQANAQLISAAPEMLETFKILKFELESREADGHKVSGLINVIEKTIAKAKGEPQ